MICFRLEGRSGRVERVELEAREEDWVVFGCFVGWVICLVEEFVVRVFKDGKVTVPAHLRDFCDAADGDYIRLRLVEVLRRNEKGEWVKRRLE